MWREEFERESRDYINSYLKLETSDIGNSGMKMRAGCRT
jgi:hypothetical protein